MDIFFVKEKARTKTDFPVDTSYSFPCIGAFISVYRRIHFLGLRHIHLPWIPTIYFHWHGHFGCRAKRVSAPGAGDK